MPEKLHCYACGRALGKAFAIAYLEDDDGRSVEVGLSGNQTARIVRLPNPRREGAARLREPDVSRAVCYC